jgi:hypothetical protein
MNVHYLQNYWIFGLCPSSDILKNTQKNTTFRGLYLFTSSGGCRRHLHCRSVRKCRRQSLDSLRLAISDGPNRVGASHRSPEDRNRSRFRNLVLFCVFLEYQTMGEVQEPSNPECYAPSPKPFTDNTKGLHWKRSVASSFHFSFLQYTMSLKFISVLYSHFRIRFTDFCTKISVGMFSVLDPSHKLCH